MELEYLSWQTSKFLSISEIITHSFPSSSKVLVLKVESNIIAWIVKLSILQYTIYSLKTELYNKLKSW